MERSNPERDVQAGALYATAILFFANLLGYIDRKILTLLVEPVKRSLGLTDGEIGLMQGAAFVITFSVAGIFVVRLVDRRNRRNLLIGSVLIWSISAAAGGLAQTGWQLFLARMGVGVGEATLIPAAVSLFADYYPIERRGKPFGFFSMGVYAGSGLSMILVGQALAQLTSMSSALEQWGIHLEPWRLVLMSVLLPGLLCCALLALMREPTRSETPRNSPQEFSGLRDWYERRAVLLPHHIAMALLTLALLGMSSWIPTVLIREYAYSPKDAGLLYGSVYALLGVCSSYTGGLVSDWANRTGGLARALTVALVGACIATIGFVGVAAAPSPLLLIIATVLVFVPASIALVTGILVVANVAPARSRGQVTAIHFLVLGVLGQAGGPAAVGYANDAFGGGMALSDVLAWIGLAATVGAAISVALTKRSAERQASPG